MAPGPQPMNGQIQSIKEACADSCAPTANPDFCFNACFKFQQALIQPVPAVGSLAGNAGSASTTYPAWQNQNGAKNSATPTASISSSSSQIIAQATDVSPTPVATGDALLTISGTVTGTGSTASATVAADSASPPPPGPGHPPHLPPWLIALSVIIPILCVVFFVIAVVLCLRLRRTHKALKQARDYQEAQEEKQALGAEMVEQREDAYVRPPSSQPPTNPFDDPEDVTVATTFGASILPGPSSSGSRNNVDTRSPLTTRLSQPVILSSTMDGAYFTGIDTADASSLHSQPMTQERDIYPMNDEEPPPPYRPASVPSVSRDSSIRNSASRQPSLLQRTLTNRTYSRCLTGPERTGSHRRSLNVAGASEPGMRNPFEDPEGDRDEKRPLTEPVEERRPTEPLTRQTSRHSRRFSLDGDARSVISEPSWMQDDHPDREDS